MRKIIHQEQYKQALNLVAMASECGIMGINGYYQIAVLSILLEKDIDVIALKSLLPFIEEQHKEDESHDGGLNYNTLLGKIYLKLGDEQKGADYIAKGRAIEDEKRRRWEHLLK